MRRPTSLLAASYRHWAMPRANSRSGSVVLDELGIEHGVIAEDAFGFALPFRDPDNTTLEFWAPRS